VECGGRRRGTQSLIPSHSILSSLLNEKDCIRSLWGVGLANNLIPISAAPTSSSTPANTDNLPGKDTEVQRVQREVELQIGAKGEMAGESSFKVTGLVRDEYV